MLDFILNLMVHLDVILRVTVLITISVIFFFISWKIERRP